MLHARPVISTLGSLRFRAICRRPVILIASGPSKGFGDSDPSQTLDSNPNVKVNERGKISSRRGPVSPKFIKEQQLEQQKQQQASITTEDATANQSEATAQRPAQPQMSKPNPAASNSRSRESSSSSSSSREAPAASTPQAVVDRMFIRMVTCAALPIVFGLLMLVVFYYQKTLDEDFPMWIVYVSQNLTFGGGLLGISYGILSTSWDPSREGSVLGWDEFRVNLPIVLNRGKQN